MTEFNKCVENLLMALWSNASQSHERFCHDAEPMRFEPRSGQAYDCIVFLSKLNLLFFIIKPKIYVCIWDCVDSLSISVVAVSDDKMPFLSFYLESICTQVCVDCWSISVMAICFNEIFFNSAFHHRSSTKAVCYIWLLWNYEQDKNVNK